jgi:hypothetical protein
MPCRRWSTAFPSVFVSLVSLCTHRVKELASKQGLALLCLALLADCILRGDVQSVWLVVIKYEDIKMTTSAHQIDWK